MKKWALSLCVAGALLVGSRNGWAQDRRRTATMLQRSVEAPRHALELRASAGYSQGVGSLEGGGGLTVQDVASVGAGLDIGIGFRLSPHFALGAFGSGALYSPVVPDSSVRGIAGGVEAAWHFRPYHALDPWISLGLGYRALWESPPGADTIVWSGFEIGRVGVGVDYRLSNALALGPTVIVDLSYFSRRTTPRGAVGGAVGGFVAAGIGLRFDFFGQTSTRTVAVR